MEHDQQAHERRRAISRELKLARERLSDLSWDLEDLEERLRALETQLAAGDADQPLLHEVEQLRALRAQQEELVIQQMLLLDQISARQNSEEAA